MASVDGIGDDTADESIDVPADRATESADLSTDSVFHILQTQRRRDVLRYVRTADGPVRLRDLAESVAAREQETTVENLSSDERQRVYISLYQSHLPKLDEEGIVDYDKDRGVVERTSLAAQLDPYLEGNPGGESSGADSWLPGYAGATVVGAAAIAAGATAQLPLSPVGAGTIAVGAFAAVTATHAISSSAWR